MMESTHEENSSQAPTFSCGYCEIVIKSVSDLKDHLMSQHKEGNVDKEEFKIDINI